MSAERDAWNELQTRANRFELENKQLRDLLDRFESKPARDDLLRLIREDGLLAETREERDKWKALAGRARTFITGEVLSIEDAVGPNRGMARLTDDAMAWLKGYDLLAADGEARYRYVDAKDEARIRADERERILNHPEYLDFARGVVLEAQHQAERWQYEDPDKRDFDWHAVASYLAAKALLNPPQNNGTTGVPARLHRIVALAALCANWHAATATALSPKGGDRS